MARRSSALFLGNGDAIEPLALQALDENVKKIIARLNLADAKQDAFGSRQVELCSKQDEFSSQLNVFSVKLDAVLNLLNGKNKLGNRIESPITPTTPSPVPPPPPAPSSALLPNGNNILKANGSGNININIQQACAAANGTPAGDEPYLTSLKDVLSSAKLRDANADLSNGLLPHERTAYSVVQANAASLQQKANQPLSPENHTPPVAQPHPPPPQYPDESEDDLAEWNEEEDGDCAANGETIANGSIAAVPAANNSNDDNEGDTNMHGDPQVAQDETFDISFGVGDEGDATDGDENDNDDATGSGIDIPMDSPKSTPAYGTPINPIAIANIVNPPAPAPQSEAHAVKAEFVKGTPITPIDDPTTAPASTPANGIQGSSQPMETAPQVDETTTAPANEIPSSSQPGPTPPQVEAAPPPPQEKTETPVRRNNIEVIVIDSESDDYGNENGNINNPAAPAAPVVEGAKEEQQRVIPDPFSTPTETLETSNGPGAPTVPREVPSIPIPIPGVTIKNAVQIPILPGIEEMDLVIPQEPSSSHSRGARKRRRSESPDMNANMSIGILTSQSPSVVLSEAEDDQGLDPDVDHDTSFEFQGSSGNRRFVYGDEEALDSRHHDTSFEFQGPSGNAHIADDDEEVLDSGQGTPAVSSPRRDPDYSPSTPRRSTRSPARSPRRVAAGRKSVTPTRPVKVARTTPITLNPAEANALISRADEMRQNFNVKDDAVCPTTVFTLYKTAAIDGDHPLAMLRMGEMLLDGVSSLAPKMKRVAFNLGQAGKWIRMALHHEIVDKAQKNGDQYYDVKGRCYSFLGDCIWLGKGRKKSQVSLDNFREGARIDRKYGQYKVGWWHLKSAYNARSFEKKKELLVQCIKELLKAFDEESGDAAAILGSIYENPGREAWIYEAIDTFEGRHMAEETRDLKAKGYYMDSYTWGCAAGTNDAGACFEVGYADVEANFEIAQGMYEQSFEMGYSEAATNLGLLYEVGSDMEEFKEKLDMTTAVEWYKTGDKLGDPRASHHLAVLYMSGKEVGRDRKKSIEYFEKAIRIASEEVVRNFGDVVESAVDELLQLCAAIIIMDDPLVSRAANVYDKYKNSKTKIIECAKQEAVWIIASELKADTYSTLKSAIEAPNKLLELLGEDLGAEVGQYMTALVRDYKQELQKAGKDGMDNGNNNASLEEVRGRILDIVTEPKMQISLELLD